MRICWWQDNLKKKDCPPQWMWHLDIELSEWFERLAEERDEGGTGDEDDERPRKRDTQVPTERNDFAKGRGRNS